MATPMNTPDILQALLLVVETLETLGVAYFVGGSVASSVHGRVRATQDVDMVADLDPAQAQPFVQSLQSEYYVDLAMIQDAIRYRSSFNVLHNSTGIKIDVFIKKAGAFAQAEMQRATAVALTPGGRPILLASPEDMILAKLDWWQQGGGISTRQWSDIIEIIRRQQQLDKNYLQHMASLLGLDAPLAQAFTDAGSQP